MTSSIPFLSRNLTKYNNLNHILYHEHVTLHVGCWFVGPCVHPFVTKLKESLFSRCLSDSIRGCVPWSVCLSGTRNFG